MRLSCVDSTSRTESLFRTTSSLSLLWRSLSSNSANKCFWSHRQLRHLWTFKPNSTASKSRRQMLPDLGRPTSRQKQGLTVAGPWRNITEELINSTKNQSIGEMLTFLRSRLMLCSSRPSELKSSLERTGVKPTSSKQAWLIAEPCGCLDWCCLLMTCINPFVITTLKG